MEAWAMLIKSKLKSHTLCRAKFLPYEMDILNMYKILMYNLRSHM